MGRSHKQAAVVAYRVLDERVEIALVRTSSGRGWVIPKGSLDKGECGYDAALRETEEEAGLLGELTAQPIGRYRYSKQDQRYKVDVYVMRVTVALESWLEAAHRSRRWMTLEKAIERLHPELHRFVHETARIAKSLSPCEHTSTHHSRTASLAVEPTPLGTVPTATLECVAPPRAARGPGIMYE